MSHRTHHGRLAPLHTESVFREPAIWSLFALGVLCLILALTGCQGGGPLGNGLGEVVASIRVTDPATGKACQVDVANGKDQTNLSLTDLSVCGGHLGSLHADRSDGAATAIAANAQVTTALGGQLIGLLGGAISLLAPGTGTGGVHKPPPPPPPPEEPPASVAPPRPLTSVPMLESPEP